MKHHRKLLAVTGALVSLTIAGGIAFATPGSGVSAAPHAIGAAISDPIKVNADRIKLQTKGPTEASIVTLTLAPGGTTGWHGHPGFAIISVTEGTGTLYFADCSSKTYKAGQAFVEAGDDPPTVFRNETTEPVVVSVSFLAPRGTSTAFVKDEANPGCAVN